VASAVIDHLIYGVRDLDAAADRLGALGLTSYFGGTHPGLGTSNRIVPLGLSYIELLAAAPFDDRFVGWMIRGAPLGDDAVPMQRVAADGTVLSWRLAGFAAPSVWELDPVVPIRIEWDEGVPLPGSVDPIGQLTSVQLSPRGIQSAVVRLHDGRPVTL
jgi:hypothetical protein